ncbi:unnamed protein product, partial [Discosporangium mesarthrocarpum]
LSPGDRDFVTTSVAYGKTIISELYLHAKDKSIMDIGGLAGGTKYIWRGILFKLANGNSRPYLGNEEAAAKGAGHDLRGATQYMGTRTEGLHFALHCMITYKGFCMTAQ